MLMAVPVTVQVIKADAGSSEAFELGPDLAVHLPPQPARQCDARPGALGLLAESRAPGMQEVGYGLHRRGGRRAV